MESAISRKTGARRFSRNLVAGAAFLFLGAGGVSRPSSLVAAQSAQEFGAPWLTVEEYEIGEGVSGGGDAAFSLISAVRVLEGGGRILVVEAAHLRVTIWRPDGSLVREVGGPGEGPGEFSGPLFAQVHGGGIHTRDTRRYTAFSSDGELIGTTPLPPPGLRFDGHRLRPRALLADGSFLAVRGYQRQDSLAVWYAAGRDGSGLRQVLLPPGFRPMDASDSHVWGVRRGELGVEYVVGRRLMPPADADPSR